MHWDRLFEELEGQLASEWEAERAALDAESERLRISRLELRARLRVLCATGADATLDLGDGQRLPVTLEAMGADWIAAISRVGTGPRLPRPTLIIPQHAITGLTLDHGMILSSLEQTDPQGHELRERMTLGFVMRDLARRRVPVHISTLVGEDVHGTIDRAAADHLDLALHDAGEARRAGAVQGFRLIPFTAVTAVRTPGSQMP
ncbi:MULTISPECIES: hypothetical protein [unclassified Microbacterium]|uniref:hypothetical protein n=1 Tax=unclassified Microbacterium TaxID=2609290 RepID=UPI000EA872E6|nr:MULTISPECIES: hypothetical protein [unclassified Microbacterium]MBT2485438.1 hypothetical protein [Microbacterium sp. ISL-108]RKN68235.1 hypothetical protein D7252_12015 [Microbacterium sp. CGR2]